MSDNTSSHDETGPSQPMTIADVLRGVGRVTRLAPFAGGAEFVVDGLYPDHPVPVDQLLLVGDPGEPPGEPSRNHDDRLAPPSVVATQDLWLHGEQHGTTGGMLSGVTWPSEPPDERGVHELVEGGREWR